MTYALVSEGYRFGGPNTVIPEPGVVIPSSFRSDSLINYEMGTRTNWLDGRLQLDVTPFYIDWSNIQVQLPTPNGVSTYGANAGEAHNYGVESTATWRATWALTLQTNVTYLSATLAEDSPVGASGAVIPKGSVLPGASKWSVASTASYQWESAPLTPTVLVSQRYRSTAPSAFANSIPLGGFDVADARLTLHPTGQFQVTGFINNILDSRGVTGGSNFGFIREFPLRPRTVGITLDYKM
jgi:outer membrane receptor protein involved in Fe transport